MKRVLIFGNSSSGKSTFAKKIAAEQGLSHLDLDTIAWNDESPPSRKPLDDSKAGIIEFIQKNPLWVIEGCYSDLLESVLDYADEVIFMDLPIASCIDNASKRPWEPHKYASKQQQDENLTMLIGWIRAYEGRDDVFSRASHQRLYEQFSGNKQRLISND